MRINVLPAQNGDCILVEYTPNKYILVDGGYVDTYRNYLLPKLKSIAEADGVVDVIVVTKETGGRVPVSVQLMVHG
jgi:hypothetical protein